MTTIMAFPMAVVSKKHACNKDFIEIGAWEYENSRPVIENMISAAVIITY